MINSRGHNDVDPNWMTELAAFTKFFREKSQLLPPIPDVTAYGIPPCDLSKREAEHQRRVEIMNARTARLNGSIDFFNNVFQYLEGATRTGFPKTRWGQTTDPVPGDDSE